MDRLKKEPALIIGILAAAVLAGVQAAAGENLIGSDVLAFIGRAIDPTQGGWLIPLLTAFVTRFFVSPATSPGV